jgi:hypothetical protein
VLLLILSAAAQQSLLAPSLPELTVATAELQAKLQRAEAVQRALQRTHNQLAERLAASGTPGCDDAAFAALAARTPLLGEGLRDRAQAARAQQVRVWEMAQAQTISFALTDESRAELDRLQRRTDALERGYRELQTWQTDNLHRWMAKCQPTLTVGPGLSSSLPPARGERDAMVAVLVVGSGLICPASTPASGLVILPGGDGCYGATGCDCAPEPLLPAAVLGPPQSGSAE